MGVIIGHLERVESREREKEKGSERKGEKGSERKGEKKERKRAYYLLMTPYALFRIGLDMCCINI